MKRALSTALLLALAGLAGLAGAVLHPSSSRAAADRNFLTLGGGSNEGYGVTLQLDRPFYRAGDTARVSGMMFNGSFADVNGWSSSGCWAIHWVTDASGQVVWSPLQVCAAVIVQHDLRGGSEIRFEQSVPLMHNAPGAIEKTGQPLSPGFYQMHVGISFNGPMRQVGFEQGLDFGASVPFQIEGLARRGQR